jgi:hypothetical protein
MAKSGREHEDAAQLVIEIEMLRTEAERVRRQCDEAVESLREAWKSLGRSGKMTGGLAKRGLSGRKDQRERRAKQLKSNAHEEAKS